jgi:two-component system alkaline phosphatase synthesis response regulator PhoP
MEGFTHPDVCDACDYRAKWFNRDYSVVEFLKQADRRKTSRHRKRILVIDDEPNILYALEETVKLTGHDCLTAGDGEEGLFLAREVKPDLVISDVIMPKVNGYELCEAIKGDSGTSHIPVILVTVRGKAADVVLGRDSGADDYIVKPFRAADLEKKIAALLS